MYVVNSTSVIRRHKSKSALDDVIKKYSQKQEEGEDSHHQSRDISEKESDQASEPPSVSNYASKPGLYKSRSQQLDPRMMIITRRLIEVKFDHTPFLQIITV